MQESAKPVKGLAILALGKKCDRLIKELSLSRGHRAKTAAAPRYKPLFNQMEATDHVPAMRRYQTIPHLSMDTPIFLYQQSAPFFHRKAFGHHTGWKYSRQLWQCYCAEVRVTQRAGFVAREVSICSIS
jgi:hypothetical protein